VSRFGGSTRGLALSLAVGEALLAPGMPSTTARAAGACRLRQRGGGVCPWGVPLLATCGPVQRARGGGVGGTRPLPFTPAAAAAAAAAPPPPPGPRHLPAGHRVRVGGVGQLPGRCARAPQLPPPTAVKPPALWIGCALARRRALPLPAKPLTLAPTGTPSAPRRRRRVAPQDRRLPYAVPAAVVLPHLQPLPHRVGAEPAVSAARRGVGRERGQPLCGVERRRDRAGPRRCVWGQARGQGRGGAEAAAAEGLGRVTSALLRPSRCKQRHIRAHHPHKRSCLLPTHPPKAPW
jgi:hypothetical protein